MATRMNFYRDPLVTGLLNPTFTPTIYGTWDNDFSENTYMCTAGFGGLSTEVLTGRTVNTAASAGTYIKTLAVSPPMPAGVTFTAGSTTWQMVARAREEVSTHDGFLMFYVAILQNDGTLIDVSSLRKDNTEFAVSASVYTARNDAAAVISGLATYTTLGGERLQCEWGWDKDGTTSGILAMQHGYSGTDIVANDTATAGSPWLECSTTFSFDPEGTTYVIATNKALMMMGCGT